MKMETCRTLQRYLRQRFNERTAVWHSKIWIAAVGLGKCHRRQSAFVIVVIVVVVFVGSVVVAERPVVVYSEKRHSIAVTALVS